MSNLIELIQEADVAMLEWENCKSQMDEAKAQLEIAKERLETAKQKFETVISQADSLGVPRNKLRKIIEERAMALVSSGLLSTPANAGSKPATASKPKATKSKKTSKTEVSEAEISTSEDDLLDALPAEEMLSEADH